MSGSPRSSRRSCEAALVDPELALLWGVATYETIGGGTSEIMRGIVAKEALGLHG